MVWWVIAAGVVGLAGNSTLLAAQPLGDFAQIEKLQATLASVAEAVSPAVVAIRAERRPSPLEAQSSPDSSRMPDDETHRPPRRGQVYPAVGSGVILEAGGAVLTNEHVIHGATPENITCILSTGEVYNVRSIHSDPRSDLAILRIDAKDLPQARLGDLVNVKQGHFVIVLGNPFGSASVNRGRPALSFGVVSALGKPLTQQLDPTDERYYGNLIQTDARINPGNSGGPMLNIRGEVIGVVTATSTRSGGSEGVGYAIPIDARSKSIITQLLRGEPVEYGFLGVRLDDPTVEDRRLAGAPDNLRGAMIRNVESGFPAAQASLQPGDMVVEFDGAAVQNVDELIRAVGAARVGSPVTVVYYRSGERRSVSVSPARRAVLAGVNMEVPITWRGLTLADMTEDLRKTHAIDAAMQGVVVTAIADGAEFKHSQEHTDVAIEEGAVLQQINGRAIAGIRDVREAIRALEGAATLKLRVEGKAVEVSVPPESEEN